MSMRAPSHRDHNQGPFLAEQVRAGDPYELSHGHPVYCAPTGGRGAGPNQLGASVVGWDPMVREAGVDAGYSPEPDMLRAPDVAVGNVPDTPGWIQGVPDLAIEYADVGQDEKELTQKVTELLGKGTKFLWVVRLTGPRRVEVFEPGKPMRTMSPGQLLVAPGVLKNPVLVESLYDRDHAERATLVNLLQRQGYESLEAVLAAGRKEGIKEGVQEGMKKGIQEGIAAVRGSLRSVIASRGWELGAQANERIDGCSDLPTLRRWLDAALVAPSAEEALRSDSTDRL